MIDATSPGLTFPKKISTLSKLIRSKATRAFLTDDGLWTSTAASATHFHDCSLALDAARKFQLNENEVELYYLFNEDMPTEYGCSLALSEVEA